MNNVNKTLYIPLYGKAYVSAKGLFLDDKKAEEIWAAEGFPLKGKAASKWLAYYLGMRACVIDGLLSERLLNDAEASVIHIGCGMDARCERVGAKGSMWYDVDFSGVIEERKRYFSETETYRMISADVRENTWLLEIPKDTSAVIVMEGVSMYLKDTELLGFFRCVSAHFEKAFIIMDGYTTFAAKVSKYRNPVGEVGVQTVYGFDDPKTLEKDTGFFFREEVCMTPEKLISQLKGLEKAIFRRVYAGGLSKKLYRLYTFETGNNI